MNGTSSTSGLPGAFYGLATLALVIAALRWADAVLIPVALALLFTFILTPAVYRLERLGLRRAVSVLIVVAVVFVVLSGIGYFLTRQIGKLAQELPSYTDNVKAKVAALRASGDGVIERLFQMGREVGESARNIDEAAVEAGLKAQAAPPVAVAPTNGPDFTVLTSYAGSAVEGLAQAGLVIVLLIFMLLKHEDLRDRLLRLLGKGHLTATTRAFDDAGRRVSRYLLMNLLVNATYGLVAALGLMALGVPYAFVWGFFMTVLRFIPYVGPWVAALMPLTLSAAVAPNWTQPLLVIAMIAVLEILSNNFMEPLVYGRSIGVSEVSLLVAAAFWGWLWGPIGLVLSAPLTVCLAVIGKYVPGLEFFEILLQDEPVLAPPQRFYQRLIARDEDNAVEVVEEYLSEQPWETVFDAVLVPALLMARRDRSRGEIDADEEQFVYDTTRRVLDDLAFRRQREAGEGNTEPSATVLGYPAHDEADALALQMLRLLVEAEGGGLEVLSAATLASEALQKAAEDVPAGVVVAALPPGGLAQTRYLCKRLQVQQPGQRIAVGRWGAEPGENATRLRKSLREAGVDLIGTSLLETRDQIVPLLQHAATVQAAG